VRPTRESDLPAVARLSREIYGSGETWSERELRSHLEVFPEGQLVATDPGSGELLGMAAGLILLWDDYAVRGSWHDFTDRGFFTNHDPQGRTLYGAEVMVRRGERGRGAGAARPAARRARAPRRGRRARRPAPGRAPRRAPGRRPRLPPGAPGRAHAGRVRGRC
jgi:hypothetical protein